jgi:hypothetical protein
VSKYPATLGSGDDTDGRRIPFQTSSLQSWANRVQAGPEIGSAVAVARSTMITFIRLVADDRATEMPLAYESMATSTRTVLTNTVLVPPNSVPLQISNELSYEVAELALGIANAGMNSDTVVAKVKFLACRAI